MDNIYSKWLEIRETAFVYFWNQELIVSKHTVVQYLMVVIFFFCFVNLCKIFVYDSPEWKAWQVQQQKAKGGVQ